MPVAEVVVAVVTLLLGLTSCTTTSSSSSAAAAAGTSARRWREEDCGGVRGEVTYDHRALVLNGTRRLLFAGEMHYPRSTPEVMLLHACLHFFFLHDFAPYSALIRSMSAVLEFYLSQSFDCAYVFVLEENGSMRVRI